MQRGTGTDHLEILRSELRRFEPFSGLSPETLRVLARHARLVDVPAGRWLVRRGRAPRGSHFLVRGRVMTEHPDRVVEAGQALARNALYPGVTGLKTLSECRLLQLTDRGMDLLIGGGMPGLATMSEAEDSWQVRFLRSHLMAALPPAIWQRLLTRLEPEPVEAGKLVIREGASDALDRCYLLARGRALVTAGGRTLGVLGAGDLFGEDALICNRPRNASVRMLEVGLVMSLAVHHFREFLAVVLNAGGFSAPDRPSRGRCGWFQARSAESLRAEIDGLDENVVWLVESAVPSLSALALFLMRKRGLEAYAAPETAIGDASTTSPGRGREPRPPLRTG